MCIRDSSETLGSEYDPNDPGIGSENDHYGLKSLYSKQEKKGKPAVSFKTGSSCEQGPSTDNKDSGGNGSESPSYSRLFASPQRKPCIYDSPCSSIRSTGAAAESTITKGLKESEGLREDLSKGLGQLARQQEELRSENRSYALQAEQTLSLIHI